MNKLNHFIEYILQENNIENRLSVEENKKILLKYFNDYEFENEEELHRWIKAFNDGRDNMVEMRLRYNLGIGVIERTNRVLIWNRDGNRNSLYNDPYKGFLEE